MPTPQLWTAGLSQSLQSLLAVAVQPSWPLLVPQSMEEPVPAMPGPQRTHPGSGPGPAGKGCVICMGQKHEPEDPGPNWPEGLGSAGNVYLPSKEKSRV